MPRNDARGELLGDTTGHNESSECEMGTIAGLRPLTYNAVHG
jgi:hypothetical protein